MSIAIFSQAVPDRCPVSVALGVFDGVHMGHQQVLQAALEGKKNGWSPAVMTFTQMPGEIKSIRQLISSEQQQKILDDMGFERLYRIRFDTIRNMLPEVFVRTVLHEQLHAKRVTCGFNYRFGRGGVGTGETLRELCAVYGIQTVIAPSVELEGEPVSATRIRMLVESGEMTQAEQLLGRPYRVDFPVVHGRALGRTIGLPTINQPFPDQFALPRFGVYAASVDLSGQRYHAVTNVGIKPTVGAEGPLAETVIFGFSGDLYGQRVPVDLLQFLRPEQKFESVEELRQQILRDSVVAEEILKERERKKTP